MHHGGFPPVPDLPALELRLFGSASVRMEPARDLGALLVHPKPFALLAYLATALVRAAFTGATPCWPSSGPKPTRSMPEPLSEKLCTFSGTSSART